MCSTLHLLRSKQSKAVEGIVKTTLNSFQFEAALLNFSHNVKKQPCALQALPRF